MKFGRSQSPSERLEQAIVKEEQIDENILGQMRNYASLISFIFPMQILPKRFNLGWLAEKDLSMNYILFCDRQNGQVQNIGSSKLNDFDIV